LRPGIKGISDNIRVISVVGRFLEHSRIYYFRNGGNEQIYLGSADLMPRNINRRVEVLFPVQDIRIIRYLHDEVLSTYLADNVKGRVMQSDGSYFHLHPGKNETPLNSQAWLINRHQKLGRE
jgi:polyphosphate kinase